MAAQRVPRGTLVGGGFRITVRDGGRAVSQKGLEEVIAASTRLSDVDGKQGRLWYVGYDIHDLATKSTFEEVTYLLHNLRLPTEPELDELSERLVSEREVSPFLEGLMPTLAEQTSPMSMLRTGVSAASAYDPDGWDNSAEANERKAVRLIAMTPTLLAMYHRMRTGEMVVPPHSKLPHAANFLYMLSGNEPEQPDAAALDTTLILYADHTFNASTFTARVIASTLSDMHSAITGAIGALKGPLHGGANEQVMKLLMDIGSADRVGEEIRERLARRERIMGFGHRVYKTNDPRAVILKRFSKLLSERSDEPYWYTMSEEIERAVLEEKGLYPNVDFYSASTYHYLGIETGLFTPIFAMSRVVGWAAHVIEQHGDNRLIRPSSEYVGPEQRSYVPIERRTADAA
jgi:citrate synthase